MKRIWNAFFVALILPAPFLVAQASSILKKSQPEEIITNPLRSDGFGGQFQTIIYSVIYAELNNKKYRYTPFANMEHNYNNDAEFIREKEQLINFIGNFEINKDLKTQSKDNAHYIRFFEQNLDKCVNSQALKKIKEIFRSNKKKEDYF